MKTSRALGLLSAALLGLAACARPPLKAWHESRDLMHTRWDFEVVSRSQAKAQAAVEAAAAEIAGLDAKLAMWQPQSELSRANAAAGSPEGVTLSAELADCVRLALNAAADSGGAFDPTVGPLTQAWWQARQDRRLLTDAQRKAGMALLGWQGVKLEKNRLVLPRQGMRLDLGGVAKGYAQDRAALVFKAHGIKRFLMNAGGQVYALGKKPDGTAWRVGILDPRDPAQLAAVLDLEDGVMSTSGDYEQFEIIQGRRVHHLLDPRTGRSVANGLVSATSVMPIGTLEHAGALADLNSTSAFVLGKTKGLEFLGRQSSDGVLIAEEHGRLAAWVTPGLRSRLKTAGHDIQFPDLKP
jgi:thiamine biosynthesis lipoprotein